MAQVDLFEATSMSNPETVVGTVTKATSTQIVLKSGPWVGTYFGEGFRYSGSQVVGGTLTGYEVERSGAAVAEVSGLSVSAKLAATLILSSRFTDLYREALRGNDDINGSKFADALLGFFGNDEIAGNGGNDTIAGNDGRDLVTGGRGRDLLFGSSGNDTVDGGAQNDRLYGDKGRDVLTGGDGSDRFIFAGPGDSRLVAQDTIADFSKAEGDKIDLSLIDARGNIQGDQKFAFIRDAAFTDRGQLRYDDGILSGDINGDGMADFAIVVDIGSLSKADLIL